MIYNEIQGKLFYAHFVHAASSGAVVGSPTYSDRLIMIDLTSGNPLRFHATRFQRRLRKALLDLSYQHRTYLLNISRGLSALFSQRRLPYGHLWVSRPQVPHILCRKSPVGSGRLRDNLFHSIYNEPSYVSVCYCHSWYGESSSPDWELHSLTYSLFT